MVVPVPDLRQSPRMMMAELIEEGPQRGRNAADERDYEDEIENRRLARHEIRAGLSKVRLGLGFHLAKAITLVVGMSVLACMGFVLGIKGAAAAQKNPQAGVIQIIEQSASIRVVGFVFRVLMTGLGIVGSTLCCFVPTRSKARGLVVTSLIMDVAPFFIGLFLAYQLTRENLVAGQAGIQFDSVTIALGRLAILMPLVSFFCFFGFLRRLALFKKKRWLADSASGIMWFALILTIVAVVGSFTFGLLSAFLGEAGFAVLGLFMLACSIALVVWVLRYIRLLMDFRDVLP